MKAREAGGKPVCAGGKRRAVAQAPHLRDHVAVKRMRHEFNLEHEPVRKRCMDQRKIGLVDDAVELELPAETEAVVLWVYQRKGTEYVRFELYFCELRWIR